LDDELLLSFLDLTARPERVVVVVWGTTVTTAAAAGEAEEEEAGLGSAREVGAVEGVATEVEDEEVGSWGQPTVWCFLSS